MRWISISAETIYNILMIEFEIMILWYIQGFFKVKSDTNGNCLFSSLSLAISWGEISPNDKRQLICDYIE